MEQLMSLWPQIYRWFNLIEALLWLIVAAIVSFRVPRSTSQQRRGVALGAFAFVLFGLSDVVEVQHTGNYPWWLWGWKIICGTLILVSRYTYIGWHRFRWRDREFLFGLSCLIAVMIVIFIQQGVISNQATYP